MKIITRIDFQMTASGLEELFRDDHFYDGPLELAGGGPSKQQNEAATSQAALTNQLGQTAAQEEAFKEQQQAAVNPFYTQRMNEGLPYLGAALDYSGGVNARSFAPAKANLMRRLGTSTGLPSGYRDQALTDFDSGRARAYDDSTMGILAANEQAKQAGASGLLGQAQLADPTAYYSGALTGNSSIMNANLRKPGMAGILGGVLGGAASAFA